MGGGTRTVGQRDGRAEDEAPSGTLHGAAGVAKGVCGAVRGAGPLVGAIAGRENGAAKGAAKVLPTPSFGVVPCRLTTPSGKIEFAKYLAGSNPNWELEVPLLRLICFRG